MATPNHKQIGFNMLEGVPPDDRWKVVSLTFFHARTVFDLTVSTRRLTASIVSHTNTD
jgi:hypothetical protein